MNSRRISSDFVPRISASSCRDAATQRMIPVRGLLLSVSLRMFASALLLLPAAAAAQAPLPQAPLPQGTTAAPAQAAAPSGSRTVAGRVVRPGVEAFEPVSGTWVTLHRVGRDRAGPLDSARTASDGSYRFGYTPSGAPDAIYFVSAMAIRRVSVLGYSPKGKITCAKTSCSKSYRK